jgi:hypothetical protein
MDKVLPNPRRLPIVFASFPCFATLCSTQRAGRYGFRFLVFTILTALAPAGTGGAHRGRQTTRAGLYGAARA